MYTCRTMVNRYFCSFVLNYFLLTYMHCILADVLGYVILLPKYILCGLLYFYFITKLLSLFQHCHRTIVFVLVDGHHCYQCGYVSVVDCGAPGRLENAIVSNGSTTFLQAAKYRCEEGYRFGSTADPHHVIIFICDERGQWIGSNISCEGVFE